MNEALALAGALGVHDVRFRAYHVNRLGTVLEDISTALQYEGQISHDNDRAVARVLRCILDYQQLPSSFINASAQTRNIAINYEAFYDGAWHTYPRGLFWIDQPQERYTPGNAIWTVQGADLSLVLSLSTTPATYVIPAGAVYLVQVAAILSNFGLRVGFDLTTDAHTTPVDFVWPPDTTWLQICTDLLEGINYYPLQADSTGAFVTRQRVTPAYDTPAIAYSTIDPAAMIIAPFEQNRGDISQALNKLKAVIDDPTRATAFVQLANNDPSSPISIATLGYAKSQEMRSDSGMKCVVDVATLQTICDFELQLANARAQPATLFTFPDPRREADEFYSVTVDTVVVAQQYRVANWTQQIAVGAEMTHTLHRADHVLLTD